MHGNSDDDMKTTMTLSIILTRSFPVCRLQTSSKGMICTSPSDRSVTQIFSTTWKSISSHSDKHHLVRSVASCDFSIWTANGGGDRFWKWKVFKLWRARDLDLDLRSGHTAYRRASLVDLYLYTNFHSNWRNFLWTDGRTDGRTFFPSNIIRSTFSKST